MIIFLIFFLVTAIYLPTFIQLYTIRWDTLDYTHAYFILPISILLIVREYKTLKENIRQDIPLKHSFLGLILIFTGIFLFINGKNNDYLSIITLSLIPLLTGITLFLWGCNILKQLLFPYLYLILLIPPPSAILDMIIMPMRIAVTVLCEKILLLFSYPVLREGLLLTIDDKDIFIAQPCSGFRSLITLVSLGIAYIYLSKVNITQKIILTLAITPLALLGNFLRILLLCLLTYYLDSNVAESFFHSFSGFLLFGVMLLGLLKLEQYFIKKGLKSVEK